MVKRRKRKGAVSRTSRFIRQDTKRRAAFDLGIAASPRSAANLQISKGMSDITGPMGFGLRQIRHATRPRKKKRK